MTEADEQSGKPDDAKGAETAKPEPKHAPAPAPQMPRRGISQWLREDAVLVLLAVILTFIVYTRVKTGLEKDLPLTITVSAEVPAGTPVRAVLEDEGRVTFRLRCSQRELETVSTQTGGSLMLQIGQVYGTDRPIGDNDTYRNMPELLKRLLLRVGIVEENYPKPKGRVFKLTRQDVRFVKPSVPTREDGLVVIVESIEPESFSTLEPEGAFGETPEIQPDDLTDADVESAVAEPDTRKRVRLKFDGWRAGGGGVRTAIQLPDEIWATVIVRRNDRRQLTNVLYIPPVLDAEFEWDFEGELPDLDVSATEDQLTGFVVGTTNELDQLEKNPGTWKWVLRMIDELPGTEDKESKRLRARFELWYAESAASGARFEPSEEQAELRIEVTRK